VELQDRLETLRGVLHDPPSAQGWLRICDLFASWPERDGLRVGLDYAVGLLDGWPDALRLAPRGWCRRLLAAQDLPPTWRLARAVSLTSRELTDHELAALASHGAMSSISVLRLSLKPKDARPFAALARSPHLALLKHLELRRCALDEDDLRALAPLLPRLEVLALDDNRLGLEGVTAILAALSPERLRRLSLRGCHFNIFGLERILERPWARLEHLDVSDNRLGSPGVERVAAWPGLSGLAELDLSGCSVGSQGLRALCGSPYAQNLRALRFASNRVGRGGTRALVRGAHLQGLETLDLSHNLITQEALADLHAPGALPKLQRLKLCGASLGSQGLAHLAHEGVLPSLTDLDLSGCELLVEALRPLSFAWRGPLASLDLSSCTLQDAGAQVVAQAELPALERLALRGNGLTSRGAEYLARAPSLPALRELGLSNNPLWDAGARALAARPKLVGLELDASCLSQEGLAALLCGRSAPHLETLSVNDNQLGERAGEIFLRPDLARLRSFSARSNRLGAISARALSQAECLAGLVHLSLSHNPIGTMGALFLARAAHLQRLETLELEACDIQDRGALGLLGAACFPRLGALELHDNPLGPDARKALADSLRFLSR
jgi:Ran GTPase-activating protein (RanGAP) involved in mRNA processing and transport